MLSLTRVLCPTDFSPVSLAAERYATGIAARYNATLVLLHVELPWPLMGQYDEAPPDFARFKELRRQSEETLAEARSRARAAGIVVETVVHEGQPAQKILTLAADTDVDLIVMGTHGRGGVGHLLLGSVAEKVLRKAQCPVMVVPPASEERGVIFSRILCPIDGSAASAHAVSFAVSLAREADGLVTLLHVVEPLPRGWDEGPVDDRAYRQEAEARAAQLLRDAVSSEVREWCRIDERVAYGAPKAQILECASAVDADIIVMGVRGRGALDVFAFGSTTSDVIRRAHCPIVAVHPPARDRTLGATTPAIAGTRSDAMSAGATPS